MLKRKLVIALAVLAAAAFAGGAYASTRDSPENARQAFLNDVAKRLHVTPAQLNSALTGALQDQLNAAVKAGKLTQAQANRIQQRAKANGGVPFLGPRFAPGPPPFGPWRFEVKRGAAGATVAAAAKYLGLTPQQLRSQLRSGKSLAQIAKAQGKTTVGLKAAVIAAVTARLDKAVAAKQITAAQEKGMLRRLSARLDALVNATPVAVPGAPPKPGPGGGPGWGPPPGGPGWGPPPGGPGWGPPPGGPGGPPWGPAAAPGGHPGSYVPTP